jgi:hypothetical protein
MQDTSPGQTHEPAGSILISSRAIQSRICEMGKQIARDYEGKKPFLVAVLKAPAFFMPTWSAPSRWISHTILWRWEATALERRAAAKSAF